MYIYWEKKKQVICKGIATVAFCVVFAGIGVFAFQRTQAADGGNAQPRGAAGNNQTMENYQKAAASSGGTLTAYIDWNSQDLKLVSTAGDEYFYISDAKQKTWDEIEAEKIEGTQSTAYCDLSWINKAYELTIKGEKNPSDILKVAIAAPRVLKAKFAIVNEELTLTMTVTETIDKKKVTTELNPASAASVQWRKGTTGLWQPYSTLDLQRYLTKGATLNLRLAGECSTDASKCYLPSKVSSVKVTKKAKAPSVKVDMKGLTLGVKKGQEYIVATDTTRSAVMNVSDKIYANPPLADIANKALEGDGYIKPLKAFTVKVRTASTTKKAASKWNLISYPAQRTTSASALTAKYEAMGTSYGATLKNNTTYNIEYFVASDTRAQSVSAAEINAKTKWATVKAGKEVKYKSKTSVIMTTETAIFFRYAQEKDNTKTPENEAELPSTVAMTHAS